MGCSLPDSSVHGILQARTLEGADISFSRGLNPCLPHWQAGSSPLSHWATCRALYIRDTETKKHVLTGRNGSQLLLNTLLWVLLVEVRTGYVWNVLRTGSFDLCSTPLPGGVLLSCRLFVGWIIDTVYRSLPIMLLRLSLCTWDLDSRIKTGSLFQPLLAVTLGKQDCANRRFS